MGKIYINCSRCGKDLECEELCDVYTSKIDDNFLCKECFEKEKPDYIQQLKQQLEEKDKDKTQLAIQELEKVKEWLEPKYFDYEQINYLTRIIDNQIKELKGE